MTNHINPALALDFYKVDHRRQYPEGTTEIYSNFTSRSAARASERTQDGTVVFGVQAFCNEFLKNHWMRDFFSKPENIVVSEIQHYFDVSLGQGAVSTDHYRELHRLGYLPIELKSLDEGSLCPIKVPFVTIRNTHPEFFWLTNALETVMSAYLWKPTTVATIARAYRKTFDQFAVETGFPLEGTPWQGHDFSFRGLNGLSDAVSVGGAHLTSFTGTDNVICLPWLNNHYLAAENDSFVGGSIPATEHSVMCAGGQGDELETYRRLIEDIYPSGLVSIVSDTWDYWGVLTKHLPVSSHDLVLQRR